MNHAFLIQCHTSPLLIGLLINKLKASNHFFFIHVDGKTKNYDEFLKYKSENVFFTHKRYKVNWGAEEQIYLTLELLSLASQSNIDFEYYHLISGQDLPIVSNVVFDDFFDSAAKHKFSFMELDVKTKIEDRFMLFHCNKICNVRQSAFGHFWEEKVVNLQRRVSRYVHFRMKFRLQPFKGNNWWSLNHMVVDYIMNYCKQHPEYIQRFLFTSCCDEVFFHTIVFNSPLRSSIVLDDLRYVDWTASYEGESLPRILKEIDYSKIIKSKKLFMRKIDLSLSSSLINKIYK